MTVANKLTPEPKSKMTENKPEHKSEQFQDKTLQLLVPNSKRLGGYTQKVPRSTTQFRSRKHSDDACSSSIRPKENMTRLPELNHEALGGLPVLGYFLQPEIGPDTDHTPS